MLHSPRSVVAVALFSLLSAFCVGQDTPRLIPAPEYLLTSKLEDDTSNTELPVYFKKLPVFYDQAVRLLFLDKIPANVEFAFLHLPEVPDHARREFLFYVAREEDDYVLHGLSCSPSIAELGETVGWVFDTEELGKALVAYQCRIGAKQAARMKAIWFHNLLQCNYDQRQRYHAKYGPHLMLGRFRELFAARYGTEEKLIHNDFMSGRAAYPTEDCILSNTFDLAYLLVNLLRFSAPSWRNATPDERKKLFDDEFNERERAVLKSFLGIDADFFEAPKEFIHLRILEQLETLEKMIGTEASEEKKPRTINKVRADDE